MLKCKVCGKEFEANLERHYVARDIGKTVLAAAFGNNDEENLYDAFDCPYCGCQFVVQGRKRLYTEKCELTIEEETKIEEEESKENEQDK